MPEEVLKEVKEKEADYISSVKEADYLSASKKLEDLLKFVKEKIEKYYVPVEVTEKIVLDYNMDSYDIGHTYFKIKGIVKNNNDFDLKKVVIIYKIDNYWMPNQDLELIINVDGLKAGEKKNFNGGLTNLKYVEDDGWFTYDTKVIGYR